MFLIELIAKCKSPLFNCLDSQLQGNIYELPEEKKKKIYTWSTTIAEIWIEITKHSQNLETSGAKALRTECFALYWVTFFFFSPT